MRIHSVIWSRCGVVGLYCLRVSVLSEYRPDVLHRGSPYLPGLLFSFGVLSTSGMTTAIALFSDLLVFITLHIYVCYFLSRILYARLLSTSGSLWRLFRGTWFELTDSDLDSDSYYSQASGSTYCATGPIHGSMTLTSCSLAPYSSHFSPFSSLLSSHTMRYLRWYAQP